MKRLLLSVIILGGLSISASAQAGKQKAVKATTNAAASGNVNGSRTAGTQKAVKPAPVVLTGTPEEQEKMRIKAERAAAAAETQDGVVAPQNQKATATEPKKIKNITPLSDN